MTQAPSSPIRSIATPARSNIYTVLAVIAFLALVVGVSYTWYRSTHLYNSGNPFQVEAPAQS